MHPVGMHLSTAVNPLSLGKGCLIDSRTSSFLHLKYLFSDLW